MINNLQHKQQQKQPKLLLFIIDHGGMKIHYNGTTTGPTVYSVPQSIGNDLPMVESINWKGNNSKILLAGESEISK